MLPNDPKLPPSPDSRVWHDAGMTECMPIAAPPDDYNLEHPGSSGRALGPELQIHNDEGEQLPHGTRGHVALRGSPLMKGYEGRSDGFIAGWFHTGDEGYIDEEGWLYIVGRSKEVINRGGETIAQMTFEDLLSIPGMKRGHARRAMTAINLLRKYS